MNSEKLPALGAAAVLFGLNAIIWLILGVVRLEDVGGISQTTSMIIALLMYGNAAGMLLMAVGIARRIRLFIYLALGFLGLNILLTITDEFGIFDLITLIIDLVLVGLLIRGRSRFTSPG